MVSIYIDLHNIFIISTVPSMFSWSLPPPAAATTQSLGARMLLHVNWTQQIRAPNASSKHPRRIASGRGLLAQSKNKVDFLTTIPDTMTALLSHEMILTSLSPMSSFSNLGQDLWSYMWSRHNPWVPMPKVLSSPNVAVKVTSLSQGWVVWVVAAITILVMVLLKVMDDGHHCHRHCFQHAKNIREGCINRHVVSFC